jgi:hypothetical protein
VVTFNFGTDPGVRRKRGIYLIKPMGFTRTPMGAEVVFLIFTHSMKGKLLPRHSPPEKEEP